jgi:peptide/nickel transport system substrate-binding protein
MLNRWRCLNTRVSTALLIVAASLLLAACTRPHDSVLRFGLATAPVSLDPRQATDAVSNRLCRLIYESLVDFDQHFMPVPALAQWDSGDAIHYRFTLAANHVFHDGIPVTAADVVATYQAILDPARASPHRGTLTHLKSVTAVDPRTVDFELSRADPLFPGLLVIGILRARDAAADRLPVIPIGSGPFRLSEPPKATRILMQRLADQQLIEFDVVPSETTRALKLVRGELDLTQGGLSPELVHWLRQQPAVRVTQQPGTVFSYLGFNLAGGPTQDLRVRRAIAHAIDREAIIRYVFKDQARLANAILVPEHWAGNAALTPIPYAPPTARALLRETGYSPARPLTLSYKTSNDHFRQRIATVLQAQLRDVGILLQIQNYDWGTLYGDIKAGRFEIFSLSWVGLQLPDILRHAFHRESMPPAGANRGRYQSARVDQLIEAAESATAMRDKVNDYRALQAKLQRDLPYVPLWFEDTIVVHGRRVVGYDTDINGHYDGLARVAALIEHVRTPN